MLCTSTARLTLSPFSGQTGSRCSLATLITLSCSGTNSEHMPPYKQRRHQWITAETQRQHTKILLTQTAGMINNYIWCGILLLPLTTVRFWLTQLISVLIEGNAVFPKDLFAWMGFTGQIDAFSAAQPISVKVQEKHINFSDSLRHHIVFLFSACCNISVFLPTTATMSCFNQVSGIFFRLGC